MCGEIAAGGMATVHLAQQLGAAGFSRVVALKRPHESYAKHAGFVAMFLDEARLAARIRHPNVVQTLDVVTDAGELFLVMEYVHGESLLGLAKAAARAGAPMPVDIAAAIVAGVLHGLHAAHEATSEAGEPLGLVHRDATPHNVMVGVDGVARVLDFGVAKATERMQRTRDGKLKGKFSYMAPEQVRSEPVDRRTDVYAVAVMLWEISTGRSLFRRDNEAATLHAVLHDAVQPASILNPAVPASLDAVIARGASRDMQQRFSSAEAMALALEKAVTLASATRIGAWVREQCAETLHERARAIADIEAASSRAGRQAAVESLREITQSSRAETPSARSLPSPAAEPTRVEISSTKASPPPPASSRSLRPGLVIAGVLGVGGVVLALLVRPKAAPPVLASAAPTTLDAALTPVVVPATCPAGMVRIEGGRFFMGSDEDLDAEKPAHHVTISAFCMDKHEVTSAEYLRCSARGDCKRAPKHNDWVGIEARERKLYDPVCTSEDPARADHPINCVEWSMADRYCRANGKRLPSEAEWEYAARGSDGRRYPWGDDAPSTLHLNACGSECAAWGKAHGATLDPMYAAADPFTTTAPVGSFPRGTSRSGLDDIVGNVWEWTADFYGPYQAEDQSAPSGPADGETRVLRGGAWNGAFPAWVRPSFRFHADPALRSHGVGFRCAADG